MYVIFDCQTTPIISTYPTTPRLRTPIGVKLDGRPAVTPSGLLPPTPLGAAGAQPMTPPETKVKDVKAE